MALFKKRETLVQNIAYMALMAAINVIFVLLTALLPALMFLIIFVLPLTSTVVTLFCKKRYFPIYFIVTIGLCLLVTSGIYIYDTFFYVLPALITGFVFGVLIEKKVPSIYIILISNVLQYVLTYSSFLILGAILPEINFIDVILNIFGLSNFIYKETFIHAFLFLIASIQNIFTYFIIKLEIKKLGFEMNENIKNNWILHVFNVILMALSVVMIFVYSPLVYVFTFMSFTIMVYVIINLLLENKVWVFIFLGVSFIATTLLFAGLYQFMPKPNSVVLLLAMSLLASVCDILNIYLYKGRKNIQ